MTEVMRLLREEHANLEKLLDVLDRQMAHFDQGDRPDYDVIGGIVEYCLDFPDQCHHPKEDLVFRKLRARDPAAADAVGDLEAEHAELAKLTKRFADAVDRVLMEAELPRDWIRALAEEFVGAYRRHIDMEERVFFPAAERALSPKDWADIDARVTARDDPLFGKETQERFRSLSGDIQSWDRTIREG